MFEFSEQPFIPVMLGGDINTYTACSVLKNDTAADVIADQYIADLEKSMKAGGETITDLSICGTLKNCAFPVVEQTAESLRKDAETFQQISPRTRLQ